MASLASLQATFNTYTLQRLDILEVLSSDTMTNIEKGSIIKKIADVHGVDFHRGSPGDKRYLKNLLSIINHKMDVLNDLIAELDTVETR